MTALVRRRRGGAIELPDCYRCGVEKPDCDHVRAVWTHLSEGAL